MAGERLHIVPYEQQWAIKREGSSKVESVHATQKDAIDAGRDTARQEEVDLVVHRQDGTFRNVLTYTNEPMNGKNGNGNGKKVEPHDLFSVGTRVSWGAIVAGAAVALAMNAVLWLGGAALGITVSDKVAARTLTLGAALWMTASSLASIFVGGFVVSRLTAGEETSEAFLYGAILWGFLFACSTALAGAGVAAGSQLASFRPPSGEQAWINMADSSEMKLSDEQKTILERKVKAAREEAGELSPKAAAWWAFTALVLSMGAAVGGAMLGAGPDFYLATTRTPQGANTQVVATS